MMNLLDRVAKILISRLQEKENKIASYNKSELEEIVNDAESFMEEQLNVHAEKSINQTQKASLFELMIREKSPLKIEGGTEAEQIVLNSKYAMSFATMILYNTPSLYIDTLQSQTVDEPFHNSLKNHLIWLKKVKLDRQYMPVFLNASYWDLVKVIYDNKHLFMSV